MLPAKSELSAKWHFKQQAAIICLPTLIFIPTQLFLEYILPWNMPELHVDIAEVHHTESNMVVRSKVTNKLIFLLPVEQEVES